MVSSSNNAITNTVGASISGVTNTLTVTNPSNTASSAARETIVVGGGTAGDPTINWNVSGVTNFEMGLDNSDSDKLKISQGTALGTNDTWIMNTSGQRTMPLQPMAIVSLNNSVANATGDGTGYLIIFDTKILDQANSYNVGTGLFTAPVTGSYLLTTKIAYTSLTAAHTGAYIYLGGIIHNSYNPYAIRSLYTPQQAVTSSRILYMPAGSTTSVIFAVFNGAKVVGMTGSAVFNEYCSAEFTLLC